MNTLKNSINRRINLPKYFTASSIVSFINSCQDIFSLEKRLEKDFILDTTKVEKPSMLGVLVLYKFIEYTSTRQCFEKPTILIDQESPISAAIQQYGFSELLLTYMVRKDKVLQEYKKLKISIGHNFIIAPRALLRGDKKNKEEINKIYLPQMEQYYKNNPKGISMILLTFSEILLNFWEHAVDDTKSIIVAHGNKDHIEIACADTGEGIISTLTKNIKYLQLKNKPEKAIKKAVEKGVTSKEKTNHMGYGLWILDRITSLTKGKLNIYSQGVYYNNDHGKVKTGTCGYWQGTIIYLSLPLDNPKTLEDIDGIVGLNNLSIKWE